MRVTFAGSDPLGIEQGLTMLSGGFLGAENAINPPAPTYQQTPTNYTPLIVAGAAFSVLIFILLRSPPRPRAVATPTVTG